MLRNIFHGGKYHSQLPRPCMARSERKQFGYLVSLGGNLSAFSQTLLLNVSQAPSLPQSAHWVMWCKYKAADTGPGNISSLILVCSTNLTLWRLHTGSEEKMKKLVLRELRAEPQSPSVRGLFSDVRYARRPKLRVRMFMNMFDL